MSTITLTKLANEGHLAPGDELRHERLGLCRVAWIDDLYSITVQRLADGSYHRLKALSFGPDARIKDKAL